MRLVAWLACAPLFWLHGLVVLTAALVTDLVTLPMRLRRPGPTAADRPPANTDATIVVLNWNGVDFLRELLPTLRVAVERAPGDHEVLVVDNGSNDDSVAFVTREHGDWTRVVRLPTNLHFIRGNRAGVEHASPARDLLVFLNNDMRVEPDFLAALIAPFDDRRNGGRGDLFAVTAAIEMAPGQKHVETGRARSLWKRGTVRFEHVAPGDLPATASTAPIPVAYAGGGATAFDRRKYVELGGFEDLYVPCYMEDVSLSWQAWKRGWRCELAPRAVVHHVHRGTSGRVFGRRGVERLDRRNRELFFWRAFSEPTRLLQHVLWQPWNAWKQAKATPDADLTVQLGALIAGLPRLPRALVARARLRARARRTDTRALALGSSVPRYAEHIGRPRAEPPIALILSTRDPDDDLPTTGAEVRRHRIQLDAEGPALDQLGRSIPRRFRAADRDGPARDAARIAICEQPWDTLIVADDDALACAAPWLDGLPITLGPAVGRSADARERAYVARVVSRTRARATST